MVLSIVAFLCAFGSLLAPYGPLAQDANAINQAPTGTTCSAPTTSAATCSAGSWRHPAVGLSALEAVGIALALGTIPGILAAVVGGSLDWSLNRIVDALMTLPAIILAVAVTAAIGNGLTQAMVPIGVLMAPLFFRVIRAATLEFVRTQYVEAATLLGAGRGG